MIWTALFFIVMAVLLVAFGFVGGCIFQNWRAGKPTVPVADPYEAIQMPNMTEVAATTAAIELVAYLPPILEPTPQLAILEPAPIPLGDVPLLAMTTDRDRWRAIAQQKDRLRGRYLRLLRAERARLAYFFSEVMDAPRRPTKARLAAVILDMPRGGHLRLVKPTMANGWAAA
jgi:hypothetical protein